MGKNYVYFQKSFLLQIELPVFTLHSSILIKIPPCTLIRACTLIWETRVYSERISDREEQNIFEKKLKDF